MEFRNFEKTLLATQVWPAKLRCKTRIMRDLLEYFCLQDSQKVCLATTFFHESCKNLAKILVIKASLTFHRNVNQGYLCHSYVRHTVTGVQHTCIRSTKYMPVGNLWISCNYFFFFIEASCQILCGRGIIAFLLKIGSHDWIMNNGSKLYAMQNLVESHTI
jgi:hypothetical protein